MRLPRHIRSPHVVHASPESYTPAPLSICSLLHCPLVTTMHKCTCSYKCKCTCSYKYACKNLRKLISRRLCVPISSVHRCPNCSHQVDIGASAGTRLGVNSQGVRCTHCQKHWCATCWLPDHPGLGCSDFAAVRSEWADFLASQVIPIANTNANANANTNNNAHTHVTCSTRMPFNLSIFVSILWLMDMPFAYSICLLVADRSVRGRQKGVGKPASQPRSALCRRRVQGPL